MDRKNPANHPNVRLSWSSGLQSSVGPHLVTRWTLPFHISLFNLMQSMQYLANSQLSFFVLSALINWKYIVSMFYGLS
jgi:hypothetical protein